MPLKYPTGLLPRRAETRTQYYVERQRPRDAGAEAPPTTIVQPVPFIRHQGSKPSCVGQGVAAIVDSWSLAPPWASAIDVWVDARRRQGNLEGVLSGTRSEYAIESLIRRGWSSYTPGEDHRSSDFDDELPSLARELAATDRRMLKLEHQCVFRDRPERVIAALHAGHGVLLSGGTRPSYQRPPADTVLGPEYRGGDSDGHCERIVGYDAERDAFIVQGSWGVHTFCVVNGRRYDGCCLVSREVLVHAWDVDILIRG